MITPTKFHRTIFLTKKRTKLNKGKREFECIEFVRQICKGLILSKSKKNYIVKKNSICKYQK